jgi:hypothetical protein
MINSKDAAEPEEEFKKLPEALANKSNVGFRY